MSIDRMRVAAVNLLQEKGYKFADGQWVATETAVALTPAAPQTHAGKCTKHAAGQLYSDLKYRDAQFGADMAQLFRDVENASPPGAPRFDAIQRFIDILHDAFNRNSI